MKVLVYLDEKKLTPRGGPFGVGYYYYTEMKRRGENTLDFLNVNNPMESVRNTGKSLFSYLPNSVQNLYRNLRAIKHLKKLLYGPPPNSDVDFSSYDIVHFHQTIDLFKERKNLEHYKGIVVLTSHSPIPFGQEKCLDIPEMIKRGVPKMKEKFEEMDKLAFERADYIIFPCPEAEEPYFNNWPYYHNFHKIKPNAFKYVLTGINPSCAERDRDSVLDGLGIPRDSFVISYVGRHNTVKGYDKLKEIGSLYLPNNSDSYFVIAGRESPFTRLEDSRWIEVGWTTEPHSYIAASDVFVLPNKETYFDIVMIEILSLGKIVIASRTGGNKFFEKNNVKGVLLYDTVEEAVALLQKVKLMKPEERSALGKNNYDFYQSHLTVSSMYDSYLGVLNEIINERINI